MTIQQHASFDSSAAELNATSKLVKAWESKNAKNAAKAGGVSLMALSLAACGGSSETVDITSDNAAAIATALTDANGTLHADVAAAVAAGVDFRRHHLRQRYCRHYSIAQCSCRVGRNRYKHNDRC